MRADVSYISPSEFERIIKAIPKLQIRKWENRDIEYLFRIAYWCGLRMAEACKLSTDDFDLNQQKVYLGKTKTEENDRAVIPIQFIPSLKIYLNEKEGELFPECNPQIVRVWTRKLGEILDIPAWTTLQSESHEKTRTHIFRKSIGKDMLWGTHGSISPLNVVQRHLRHKSIESTNDYLQQHEEDVKNYWKKSLNQ